MSEPSTYHLATLAPNPAARSRLRTMVQRKKSQLREAMLPHFQINLELHTYQLQLLEEARTFAQKNRRKHIHIDDLSEAAALLG